MTEPKRTLAEFADEKAEARYQENQELARTARVLRSELIRTKESLADAKDAADVAQRELALHEADYSKRPDWLKPTKMTKENRGTLVAMFSDSHYGEIVNPSEMDGYNKYNLAIAEKRTQRFFTRTVRLARDFLAGVKYDGIVLALNGDIVSGDIHDELVETNEASTYETILWAVPKLAAGIDLWRTAFGKVHVVSAPGNHGRNSLKPRYKKRSANNADTLIARLVARQFSGEGDVTFDIPETPDVDFKVYGSRFTMEHGDEFNFNGTSEIGSIGPVKRGTLRKQSQKTTEGKPFDYCLVSHFHQYVPASTQGFIMNGSLKGADEYSRGKKFKPELAQQALMVVTPERAITTQMPVFVADTQAEGWA